MPRPARITLMLFSMVYKILFVLKLFKKMLNSFQLKVWFKNQIKFYSPNIVLSILKDSQGFYFFCIKYKKIFEL